jgi:hypothetical protein
MMTVAKQSPVELKKEMEPNFLANTVDAQARPYLLNVAQLADLQTARELIDLDRIGARELPMQQPEYHFDQQFSPATHHFPHRSGPSWHPIQKDQLTGKQTNFQ